MHCQTTNPTTMQYLYFSEDLQYMYERSKHERHFLYQREQPKQKGLPANVNEISWTPIHRFHNIPVDIVRLCEYPFIFSPNFKRYIDLEDKIGKFVIRNPHNHESVICEVPSEIVSTKEEKVEDVMRRFRWVTDDLIHVISHDGIERIIDVANNFKEIAFNFIPLYDAEICKHSHYMLDSPSYDLTDCLRTLKKRYQYYKSGHNMKKALDPNYDLYSDIFALDYRIDNCKGQFETGMSFIYLYWSLIEQLLAGNILVSSLDDEIIELIFYNILPHGNTVLHAAHENGDLLIQLLQAAHSDPEDRQTPVIHIPFLKNIEGKSPIHLCVEGEQFRYINDMLEYLARYDIDHHSRAI